MTLAEYQVGKCRSCDEGFPVLFDRDDKPRHYGFNTDRTIKLMGSCTAVNPAQAFEEMSTRAEKSEAEVKKLREALRKVLNRRTQCSPDFGEICEEIEEALLCE